MIIGLTGSYCSGKDTVAHYLEKKGFTHYSLSDELREELVRRHIEPTRENLIRVGTELRRDEGNGVLARRVLCRFFAGKNYVVTSLRHPAEVDELRKQGDFHLVDITAPLAVRFERMCSRNRPGDPTTVEKLRELEEKESQTEGPGQQLRKTADKADVRLANDTDDTRRLFTAVDDLVERLSRKK